MIILEVLQRSESTSPQGREAQGLPDRIKRGNQSAGTSTLANGLTEFGQNAIMQL
ncbi:hypothetical protein [Tardiphaga alba]|uniref:hypothetical protein n=1 Tax=Tardiphaga alba TaxID=340268 RepID=UPI001BAE0B34|nr:hypothetical protein [Tardiphaga alba]